MEPPLHNLVFVHVNPTNNWPSPVLPCLASPAQNTLMWNDFILCIEMVVFSALLMCAFPASEFQGGIPDSRFMDNVKSVLSVRDVAQVPPTPRPGLSC
jgi:hypothetical protein